MATETWVLNNSGGFDSLEHIEVAFNSNNSTFYGIRSDTMKLYYYTDDTNKREVFNGAGDGWTNTAYRTITFETAPTGDLLTWLQANGTKQASVERVSVDLATAFPDKWAGLTIGKHTLQIRAKNPGNYLDSDLSTAKTFVKVVNYTITANLTNCVGGSSNPTTIASNTTGVVLTFTANTGYDLPASVTVTGATSSWNQSTGELTLTKPTGNVTITIAATAKTYNITVNATNATAASTNPTTIVYGAGAQLKFTFPDGYYAPTAVTVNGATQIWDAGTGALTLSNCTGPVTVTIEGATKTFNITYSLTNVNSASGNPTTIASNASAVKITLVKPTGYNLPNEVAITGVDAENWSYDGTTGIITISRPTANVTISAVGQAIVYNIAVTTENATADPTNPTTITYGTTATLQFTFPTDHTAPDDVTVTGATKQWTKSTGTLVLSNPTANVTVQVAGVWELKELTGTYTWKETIPEATWTEQLVNFALADGTAYKKMYWTDNGTTYNLYYDDMLEGGSETKVYSYDADAQTGTWVDPKYRIVNFTSEDVQYVPANFYNYVIANTTQTAQLSTPQNVTADGTVVSWDEVENATIYAVLADGSEIGTVEKVAEGYDVTLNVTENISNIIVMINDTIQHDISDVGTKTYNNVNKIELTAGDADLHITNSTGSFINGTYYTKEFIITSNSSCSIRHGY